ncbi:MAG: hypothetical protein GXO88_13500 [Chlorobi bacterium]|nr:hypothetical protein [Chlorobiota bacterium]
MKNISSVLIVFTAAFFFITNSSFTAIVEVNNEFGQSYNLKNDTYFEVQNQEEKKIKIKVEDGKPNSKSTIKFEILWAVGPESLGQFTIAEGDSLILNVSHTNLVFNIIENNNDANLIYYFL